MQFFILKHCGSGRAQVPVGKVEKAWKFTPSDFSGAVFVPKEIGGKEALKRIQRRALRRFHLSPGNLLGKSRSLMRSRQLRRMLSGFLHTAEVV